MKPRNPAQRHEDIRANIPDQALDGLTLSGTVIERTRRMVPHNNPTTEIVTYTVQDSFNRKYYVDDYAPTGYHSINENVTFPVYIKAYVRKNGEASYTLNIQKSDLSRGEHF